MAADVAGSAMAHVWFRRLPRGSGRLRGLRSGRCCRPRRALQRPSVSPTASSAGAAAAAAHARAAHCRLGEDGTHHQRAIYRGNSCWHGTKASALQTQWPRRIDKACLRRPRPLGSSARRRARRAPRRARRHASGRTPGWARAGREAWQQEPWGSSPCRPGRPPSPTAFPSLCTWRPSRLRRAGGVEVCRVTRR